MTKLRRFYVTLKGRGLRKTLAILLFYVADYSFDVSYGTDTRSWTSLDSLVIDSDNLQHGEMYQPTLALPLERLFQALQLPDEHRARRPWLWQSTGAAGGFAGWAENSARCRVLAGIVSHCPSQLLTFRPAKTHVATTFEIIEGDVVDYVVRQDETVFFLYNPFDGEILRRVLASIRASQHAHPRPVWIIYRNAVHSAVIDNTPGFVKSQTYVLWGLDFVVYQSQDALHEPAVGLVNQTAPQTAAPVVDRR